MRNETPADGVAMRMLIGAGRAQEQADAAGAAHFLEHMAFRGSKNVSDGELIRILEREGLQFGDDSNAFTGTDRTFYMFNFPKVGPQTLDTGLMLFREIGERLTLDPAAVRAESKVMIAEERVRDNAPRRVNLRYEANLFAGTAVENRLNADVVSAAESMTAEKIRSFYAANYQPNKATIIVVGAIDVDDVEARIKARFSDWARVEAPTVPAVTAIHPPTMTEVVEAGAPDQLLLSWMRPPDAARTTRAGFQDGLYRTIGLIALNNRLNQRALSAGSPFQRAVAGNVDYLYGSSLTELGIMAQPDKWAPALDAAVEMQRQLLEKGLDRDEFTRAITMLRTQLAAATTVEPTMPSIVLADQLLNSAQNGSLFRSPAQDLALATPMLDEATPEKVLTSLRHAFSGRGPVLLRSAQSGPVGKEVLATRLEAAYAAPLTQRTALAAVDWPYTDFGAASAVTARSEDPVLGTTKIQFGNGTTLTVKRTAVEKDRVNIAVNLGHGRMGVAPDLTGALWAANFLMPGGTGKLSLPQIQLWAQTSAKLVNVAAAFQPQALVLSGATKAADLIPEMQLLAAYVRDPGFRPEAAQQLAATTGTLSGQLRSNISMAAPLALQMAVEGGDRRFVTVPAPDDVAATKVEQVTALLRTAMTGPADVVMVGDIGVDDAIAAVQSTFGAGPALPKQTRPKPQPAVHIPAPAQPMIFTHGGRADQATYMMVWRVPAYWEDRKLNHAADVAAAVLRNRMTETVRKDMGLTYTPEALALPMPMLPQQGVFAASIETPEANFATFKTIMDKLIADLAATPITADELARARQPILDARHKEADGNGFWAAQLSSMTREPRMRDFVLERVSGIEAVTAADVQHFFATRVKATAPQIVITKAGTSAAATPATTAKGS